MDPEDIQEQTKVEVAGSSHDNLPSSNDDTSHPSISEPQPTVSSQDVSIPAPKLTQEQKRKPAPGTSRDVKIARLSPTSSSQDVSIPAPKLTKEEEAGSSHDDLPSSNDDTSHPSISEPQPTVSSQDVSIPAPQQPVHYNITNSTITNAAITSSNINLQSNRTSTQQSNKLEEIILKLEERAIVVCGETLFPPGVPGRITKPVPLLITLVRQILDDEWKLHRNQREDLQRMYTSEGSILIEELFDVAKQVAQQEADRKCTTPEAKAMHVVRYGNIVCVVGLPGVGKSTLLKQMINCIVVDKSVKPDTQFLFHVSLKKFNPKKKVSLLEFLLCGNLSEWNHSDEENKALVRFLYNNPNVVILIDGWDELYTKQASKRLHACQLDSKQIPEVFVKNLLMGNLLPNAAKFITSRPGQFYELHPDYRQGLVSEVRGMDKPAKKDLTKQLCGEADLEKVEKLLAERPNLDALCSIPVHCIQIVACLHSSVLSGREINSMTDVFIHTLTNYKPSDHVRTNMSEQAIGQELVKLAHLAYKGLAEKKLLFQQADFEEVGINEQTVDMFLHTYVEKSHHLKMRILEGKKRSYFTHLTSHEFYAAVHLMLFMSKEEFRRCMVIFYDPHWDVVTRFLFGICNSTSYEDLKVIFPASTIKDYKEKKTILKSLMKRRFKKKYITFSGWVHEANDAEISQRFQECMPQLIKMKAPIYPTEISDVVFAFNTFTTPHDLDLYMDKLDEASVETLLRGLHGSQAKIKVLDIWNARMTNSMTQALLPHLDVMDKLYLDEGRLSAQNLIILHEAVERLTNPQGLTVNDINGDRWSKYWELYTYQPDDDVMQILQLPPGKIKVLDIWNVRMTDSTTQALLPHLDVMDKLGLDEGRLSAQNLIILHEAVERLTNPQGLTVNGINGDRWSKDWELYKDQPDDDVMQILQLPPGKIKVLDIWNVRMTDSTTQALLPHLNVMDKLDLDEEKLSAQNRIILHEAVERLTNPQGLTVNDINGDRWPKHWELYEDQPDDDVMQILQLPLGKIKVLDIWNVWMTDSTTQALLPHLNVMDKLSLDEEKLSAQNLIILHEAVERLTNPQGLKVNDMDGDQWLKKWKVYDPDEKPGKEGEEGLDGKQGTTELIASSDVLEEEDESNDDTSHPSISEPQPTVSSQDVSIPAPKLTKPKVAGSSHDDLPSSNDDTSHSSISEPQPTVSPQDVSIPAPNSTQGLKGISEPGTSRDVKIARLSPTSSSQDVSILAPQSESSSKWIGSSGGKLEVGGCELVVPPGALEEDVEMKLTASLPLESEYLETPTLQCEPASLTFKKQVTIKLQTHVVLDEETDLGCKLLHSDDGRNWEPTKTELKFRDNFISFETNHFSWWKIVYDVFLEIMYSKPPKVRLYSLLCDNADDVALVWKVCADLDLAKRGNDSEELWVWEETLTIETGNDLRLCIEACDTNEEVEIWPSEKTTPADQINTKYQFGGHFNVIRKSSNRIKLEAKANCGNSKWDQKILFPIPRKQVAGHQPVPQNVTINNSTITNSAVQASDKVNPVNVPMWSD
ncbi:uncharacterized protein LOC144748727 [Ciona intestinalis]